MATLSTYLSFVRVSHTVFALPFAFTGALLAARQATPPWTSFVWILVCMVSARSAAMGFNRIVDARFDALNPRTANRELPRGAMTTGNAWAFVGVAVVVFVGAAFQISALCGWLSPLALAIVGWYSLAKRYTYYTQAFLGLAMAVAPVGGWLAAGGGLSPAPWLLGLAIGLWVAGFDIIYACQDHAFDVAHGLKSIPVRFGVAGALRVSRLLHVATVAVMGGDDWKRWIDQLADAGVLAPGFRTLNYTYIGSELTWPIYWHGTLGRAKVDLDSKAEAIRSRLGANSARVVALKAVVTQASSAIPVVPLYGTVLFKVMKQLNLHEGCIEQIDRLFRTRLGKNAELDEAQRIRVDDWELSPEVQAEVLRRWPLLTTETLGELADLAEYRSQFLRLFGFGIDGVDYAQDVDPRVVAG